MKPDQHVRTRHDEWTKDALELWLGSIGKVQLDARIAGSVRRGDVLFHEEKSKAHLRKRLGLLGEFARGSVLFEAFRNPVTPWEIETCVVKIIEHTAQKLRSARRVKKNPSTVSHTKLCIITPSLSEDIKKIAGLTAVSPDKPGVYCLAKLFHTIVIVVKELPTDQSTLWLRLLGRDDVQRQAALELVEMTKTDPLRDATLHLLTAWYENLPQIIAENLEQDAQMNWRRVYAAWERKTLAKGRAEGKAEGKAEGQAKGIAKGKAEAVLIMLKVRGLHPTAKQRDQILACQDVARLDQWLVAAHLISDVKDLFAIGAPTRRRTQHRAA